MDGAYNSKLDEEKHKRIDEILGDHEERLKDNARKIESLEQDGREYKIEIKNLIKKMDSFITTLMWGLGIFVTVSIFVIGILIKK